MDSNFSASLRHGPASTVAFRSMLTALSSVTCFSRPSRASLSLSLSSSTVLMVPDNFSILDDSFLSCLRSGWMMLLIAAA